MSLELLLLLCLAGVTLLLSRFLRHTGHVELSGRQPLAHPEWRIRGRVAWSGERDETHGYGSELSAVVNCRSREDQNLRTFESVRRESCLDLQLQYGGERDCNWACLGAGDCVDACPENAIRVVNGLPVIQASRCTGCGDCLPACPRQILSLIPADAQVAVTCASDEPVERRREHCHSGCASSGRCVENAFVEPGLLLVDGQRRVLDYSRSANLVPLVGLCPSSVFSDRIAHRPWFTVNEACTGCGDCLPACPVTDCIRAEGDAGTHGARARIHAELCVGCGLCVPVCPVGAIRVVGAVGFGLSD